ncbi:hypothetical protein [Paenibacillus sp. H1-7]|nr:hypothetical protein [Paenibacillus sp. H1-7]
MLSIVSVIAVIAGCSSGSNQEPAPAVQERQQQEAVTLKAYAYNGALGK